MPEWKEYGEKVLGNESSRRVSCWIKCQTGQEFAVRWEAPRYDTSFLVQLFMDGKFVDAELLDKNHTKGNPPGWRVAFEGFRQEDETVKPFIFSNIQFDPDAPFNDDSTQIGVISLRFFHILLKLEDKRNINNDKSSTYTPRSQPDTRPLGEEKSRLVTHRVSAKKSGRPIKRPKAIKQDIIWTFKFLPEEVDDDTKPEPFLVFEFKYRSKAFLRANNFIGSSEKTATSSQHRTVSKGKTERQTIGRRKRKAGPASHDNDIPIPNDDEANETGRRSFRSAKSRMLDDREESSTRQSRRPVDNDRNPGPRPAVDDPQRYENWVGTCSLTLSFPRDRSTSDGT